MEGNYIVKISNGCNANCIFCADSHEIRSADSPDFESLLQQLKENRQKFDSIIITGGEPTIHPRLIEYLEHVRDCKFRSVMIATNGFRLKYLDFTRKLHQLGVTGYQISFQTTDAKEYYSITGIKDALSLVDMALLNVRQLHQRVNINTCVHKLNYRKLPEIALHLDQYADYIQFAFMNPVGSSVIGGKSFVAVSFSDALPYLREAVASSQKVHIENIPICVIPDMMSRISDLRKPEANKAYYNNCKRKPDRCAGCKHFEACDGAYEAYLKQFGERELEPIKD
jgi:MoaA/NifB/PqqE/SkfB family radical SAM enzyme